MDPRLVVPLRDLAGARVRALDGFAGRLETLLIDHERWTVRWLRVALDSPVETRSVLLPPGLAERWDPTEEVVDVRCTRDTVLDAPALDADAPVSPEHESALRRWYGATPPPGDLDPSPVDVIPAAPDPFLRSADELVGWTVRGPGGREGRLVDLRVDTATWAIRGLEIDTKPWWPGAHVLLDPSHVRDVRWAEHAIVVDLPPEEAASERT